VANSNGSIMPNTEKELPTEITPQPRNSTRGLQHKLPDRARQTGDGLNKAGRISAKAEQISPVEALSRAVEHSAAWTAAVVRKTSAAGGNRAVKVCPVAVAGSVVVPVVVEDSVAVAADAAAEEGDNHVNISINNNETGEGGRNVVHGNAH